MFILIGLGLLVLFCGIQAQLTAGRFVVGDVVREDEPVRGAEQVVTHSKVEFAPTAYSESGDCRAA
jgi:hypothetical protein